MANLENNYDNEKDKLISDQLGDEAAVVNNSEKKPNKFSKNEEGNTQNQSSNSKKNKKWWVRLLLSLFWLVIGVFFIFLIIINLSFTKNWASKQAIDLLNKDFNAKISTESVEVDYFGDVTIKGLKILDYKDKELIKAKELKANSNWLKLAESLISGKSNSLIFNSLILKNADVKVVTYKGDSISNFVRYVANFDNGTPRDPKKPPFQFNSRIEILDSKVSIINENSPGEAGKWLSAENLNLVAPHLQVEGRNVSAQLNNLSFVTTRWGKKHIVDTFSADLSLTKDFLLLKETTIHTDYSLLQGNMKFNLHDNGSWSDFSNKVKWEMNLSRGSQISGYDISYFVTNWDNYNPINISGEMNGPLNQFNLKNFVMGNRAVHLSTHSMNINNLLNGNFLIETNDLSTDFTYKNLKAMLPSFISSKMKNFADDFGILKYNGKARVTPQQIYIQNGGLVTGIGQAKISNLYLWDYSTNLPKYKGYAEVQDLNTSVITKNKQVGLISGKFNIDGESFDVNKIRLKTESQISKIEILNKEINNLYLNGLLDHKQYKGIITVNDQEAKADINGFIDFRTSKIQANLKAGIDYLNLNYFTGKTGKQMISGKINGTISMSNINDLNLNTDIENLNFATATSKYNIPKANLKAFFENGNRIIEVDAPDAIKGRIVGKYNLEDLVGMVKNGLNKILVGPEPRKQYRGQSFTMNFDLKQDVLNYFIPEIKIPQGALADGSYEGNSNDLVLNINAEELKYMMTKEKEISDADKILAAQNPDYKINTRAVISKDSAIVNHLVLNINTANLDEQISAKLDRLQYNKNILKDVVLKGKNENNQLLRISTNFKYGTQQQEIDNELKAYSINFNQSTNAQGDFVFRFDPTEVQFNNVVWAIDTTPSLNHSIVYRKKTGDFLIENLKIFSDESQLVIHNATFKSAKDFSGNGNVQNLEISKLLEMQNGGNAMDIQGVANGSFDIKMNAKNLSPIIDLKVDHIQMNQQDFGSLIVTAKNSVKPNVFDIEGKLVSAGIIGDNNLLVKGTIDNNTPTPTLDLKSEMKDFDLGFSQQFVQGIFSNLRGKANGILSISGPFNNIDYSGDIALKSFGLKLNFTGVDYRFDDTVVNLSKGLAILNDIGVKDARDNSSGTISGTIFFETLSSMGVNLLLRSENLLVLDTNQNDSDLFWGRVYGNGTLYIDGPVSGLSISTPDMKALNNSIFTFNSNSTSSTEEFKMLRFLKEDKTGQISLEEKKKSGANMNIDFMLNVDKGTTVNVLVGDDLGDITVRGNSNDLNFRMSRSGNITINGAYQVENGTYISKAILNKTFHIAKGSIIRWDGDAMTPSLDIIANYRRSVSNVGDYLNMGNLPPVSILLETKITGTLNKPDLYLGVNAEDVSSQVKETLASKMSQNDERTIQFGSILLLNRFNSSNSEGATNFANIVEVNGYNLVLKQLGSVLNTISNIFQIDLSVVKGDIASNTSDRANAGVNFILSPRVTLKTGLGIPLSQSTVNTEQNFLSGEGTIEYDASKKNDGSLVLRAYSKPMNIGMTNGNSGNSANQAYGGGVVWSRNFDHIFRKKNKKNTKKDKEKRKNKSDSIKNDSLN